MASNLGTYTAEEIKNQTPTEERQRDASLLQINAISIEKIATLLETGILDINNDDFLFQLEKRLNRRINPKNPISNKNQTNVVVASNIANVNGKPMKVAKIDQLEWMDKQMSKEERYKVAIEKKDSKIASSEVFQKASFPMMVENNYKKWCVPELFDYLSMGGEKALEELRAVAYPMMVSFNQESFISDEKTWMVPYITFSYNTGNLNNGTQTAEEGYGSTFSFYLNHKREVQIMRGKIVENYYEHDFHSKADMLGYIRERRDKLDEKNHTQTKRAYFLNIKLAEGVHAIIKNKGTEGNLERRKGVPLDKCYKWCQVYNVSNCKENGTISPYLYWQSTPEKEKQRIEEVGRKAMENLDKLIFNPKNYVYRSGRDENGFHECYGSESLDSPFLQ